MKKVYSVIFFLVVVSLTGFVSSKKTEDKPGFTITVNGDQFTNQTFYIPPSLAGYDNLYFDFKDDARVRRTTLSGFKLDNTLQLIIDVPIHKEPGSFTFIEDSIPPYMGFQFTYEKNDGSSYTYMPGKITVTITKYGKVGEFIEGNLSGQLQPKIGGKTAITLNGSFNVKRIRDRT